jgi:hypothetical protein
MQDYHAIYTILWGQWQGKLAFKNFAVATIPLLSRFCISIKVRIHLIIKQLLDLFLDF